jgi:hypothetical protein
MSAASLDLGGVGLKSATLCEYLPWFTLSGIPKIHAWQEFLKRLQAAGLLV